MATITRSVVDRLSDSELLAQVRLAVGAERLATAHLISLLMELDSRRLYLGEGFSSLFTYCTHALHLSEHAAYNRIETARAARRFPVILDMIEQGAVTLTSVRLLAPHLTSGTRTSRTAEVKPLAPERFKIQFTIDRDMYDKLRRAQDLLRHSLPSGDAAVIFERALTLLVAGLERRKTAATERPRHTPQAGTCSRQRRESDPNFVLLGHRTRSGTSWQAHVAMRPDRQRPTRAM